MPGSSPSGGSGGGMTMPISGSIATSAAFPQLTGAPTYFIFDSPGTAVGAFGQTSNPILPSTATSSAAAGGPAQSSTQGSGVGVGGGGASGIPLWEIAIFAAVLGGAFYAAKKFL